MPNSIPHAKKFAAFFFRTVFSVLLLATGSGCSYIPLKYVPPVAEAERPDPFRGRPVRPAPITEPAVDPVMASIAGSANQIAQYIREMKSVETAAVMPDLTQNKIAAMNNVLNYVPPGLGARISVQYSGGVDQLIEAIANSVGWKMVKRGPVNPVLQVVHKKYVEERAVDALRDLGYSVNGIDIILDSKNKQIIIRYKN